MTPVMLATESFEVFLQQGPHPNDAISHFLDFAKPLFVQGRVIEDLGGDSSTVHWRVRV